MLLDLSEIVIRDGMRVGLDVDQPGVEDPDLQFAKPLTGHLTFENGGDLVNIHGEVDTTLTIACSRCLKDVEVPMTVPVEEHLPIEDVVQPNRKPDEGAELPDTQVSSVVYLDQGKPILDLDELMRQLIVAELPMRTLCDEECAGLCPHCGVDRNETPCNCAEEQRNTPLAALAALLPNGDSPEPEKS